jgi:hypothetical protein
MEQWTLIAVLTTVLSVLLFAVFGVEGHDRDAKHRRPSRSK